MLKKRKCNSKCIYKIWISCGECSPLWSAVLSLLLLLLLIVVCRRNTTNFSTSGGLDSAERVKVEVKWLWSFEMKGTQTPEEQRQVPAWRPDARDTPSMGGGAETHLSFFKLMFSIEGKWSWKLQVSRMWPTSLGFIERLQTSPTGGPPFSCTFPEPTNISAPFLLPPLVDSKATELKDDRSPSDATVRTTFTILLIDVNDNAPNFNSSEYRVLITELAQVGFALPLFIQAEDKDEVSASHSEHLREDSYFSKSKVYICPRIKFCSLSIEKNVAPEQRLASWHWIHALSTSVRWLLTFHRNSSWLFSWKRFQASFPKEKLPWERTVYG